MAKDKVPNVKLNVVVTLDVCFPLV